MTTENHEQKQPATQPMGDPQTPNGQSATAGSDTSASQPGAIPHIKLSAELANPMDVFHSGQLLASCLKDGVYHCPRCPMKSDDKIAFMEHLTEEVNKSLTELAQLSASRMPTPYDKPAPQGKAP